MRSALLTLDLINPIRGQRECQRGDGLCFIVLLSCAENVLRGINGGHKLWYGYLNTLNSNWPCSDKDTWSPLRPFPWTELENRNYWFFFFTMFNVIALAVFSKCLTAFFPLLVSFFARPHLEVKTYKLSYSKFTFVWDKEERVVPVCLYLGVAKGISYQYQTESIIVHNLNVIQQQFAK